MRSEQNKGETIQWSTKSSVRSPRTSRSVPHYDNWIGGKWVPPVRGQHFDNISPITGKVICTIARSTAEDVELALDAAHAAREAWGRTSPTERSNILNKIADRIESRLPTLALVESIDNGKPIRETTHADMPLVVDHFRYFAGVIRARKAASAKSTTTPWHTTSTSRSAWSPRSSRGTSRS